MPVNPDDPEIPVGCEDVALFDAESDLCTPELNYGPIRENYFTNAAFAAPPTAVEITRRLALPVDDPEAMTGPFVAAVSTNTGARATEEFNGKLYAKPSRREFPVTTKETSQKNVALADRSAKGGIATRMFGIDSSGYWHGGQTGMGGGIGNLVLDLVIPDGFDTAQTITGTFTTGLGYFRGKRILSPIPLQTA
jgi:hypothetical protein